MSSDLLSYDEAAAEVADYAAAMRSVKRPRERVELGRALGRVLARPLRADRDQPPFARSTRDGYACRAADAARHALLPVMGATRAGEPPAGHLPEGAAWEIMTGAAVPKGADAVVMLEHVEAEGCGVKLQNARTIAAGDNIVARGAQARKGEAVLAAGTTIAAGQIALAATCGESGLEVFARPRVAILTTGDEIVPVQTQPGPGQIRNSNAPMLAALTAAAGGEPWVLPTAADTAEALDAAFSGIAEADLLLVTGGVSAGKFDLVEPALERAGARFHFTGVRIQPGKPTVFGEIRASRGTSKGTQRRKRLPLFGLPGNPVSSAVTFLLFAAPVLASLAGRRDIAPRFAMARLSGEVKAKAGLTRFLPAICDFGGPAGALPEVALVLWQGSGDLAALGRSNCFLVIPEDAHRLEAGSCVRILLP